MLQCKARFPFKRNRLRYVRCVNENRKKCKRLRWQAANHGCHCFDEAFLLAGAPMEWKPGLRWHLSEDERNADQCRPMVDVIWHWHQSSKGMSWKLGLETYFSKVSVSSWSRRNLGRSRSHFRLKATGWRKKMGPPYLIANILKIP